MSELFSYWGEWRKSPGETIEIKGVQRKIVAASRIETEWKDLVVSINRIGADTRRSDGQAFSDPLIIMVQRWALTATAIAPALQVIHAAAWGEISRYTKLRARVDDAQLYIEEWYAGMIAQRLGAGIVPSADSDWIEVTLNL